MNLKSVARLGKMQRGRNEAANWQQCEKLVVSQLRLPNFVAVPKVRWNYID